MGGCHGNAQGLGEGAFCSCAATSSAIEKDVRSPQGRAGPGAGLSLGERRAGPVKQMWASRVGGESGASAGRRSARLGFILIKGGLPKVSRLLFGSCPPRRPLFYSLLLLPSACCSRSSHSETPPPSTHSSAFPPVGLRYVSLHSPSKYRRKKKKEQINYLDFFFSPQRDEQKKRRKKSLTPQFEKKGTRNKCCISYKIWQSASRGVKNSSPLVARRLPRLRDAARPAATRQNEWTYCRR